MLEAEWRQVLRGSVSTGTKEAESITGRVWAPGFHHVTARSRLGGVLKFTNRLFLKFSNSFGAAVNRGKLKPRILNSVDTGARLYFELKFITKNQTKTAVNDVKPKSDKTL
jgi:hypothetical protein